ncbi:MAG: hypothetical protein WAQ27_02290, partial [Candidatus Microsaccharimonas sp.]
MFNPTRRLIRRASKAGYKLRNEKDSSNTLTVCVPNWLTKNISYDMHDLSRGPTPAALRELAGLAESASGCFVVYTYAN